jgi:hypothetical protein
MNFSIIEEMNHPDLEPLRLLQNNVPLDDFSGLSPAEMHHLLYDTFGDKSPLNLRNELQSTTLANIPFFLLTEEFLKILMRENSIKLTPLGALPRKTVHELYSHKFITEDIIEAGAFKLSREQDSIAITSVHLNLLASGSIKRPNGRLSLTKKGQQLVQPEQRINLFKETLSSYTEKFNWASNDGYTPSPVGQLGWGFTVYLLKKFGQNERPIEFYAEKYLKAFPRFLEFFPVRQYGTPIEDFANCYRVRTFERFLEWFGFVKIDYKRGVQERHSDTVRRTGVFEAVFKFT